MVWNRTLGGRQLWGDVEHFHRWRVQRNVITGHHRLIDPMDRRYAAGSREKCREKLDAIIAEQDLPQMSGRAVILLHGIWCSSKHFRRMIPAIDDAGFACFLFDYPSTRISIHESARYLGSVIRSLDGIEEISFVSHSMGGLVCRQYLADTAEQPDDRIKQLLMIGTPNLGADLADRLHPFFLFRWLFGPPAKEMSPLASDFIEQLPPPRIPFGIITGSLREGRGGNPLITGDDDFIVSADSTQLEGAADTIRIAGLHRLLPYNPRVIEATVQFLKRQRFDK